MLGITNNDKIKLLKNVFFAVDNIEWIIDDDKKLAHALMILINETKRSVVITTSQFDEMDLDDKTKHQVI